MMEMVGGARRRPHPGLLMGQAGLGRKLLLLARVMEKAEHQAGNGYSPETRVPASSPEGWEAALAKNTKKSGRVRVSGRVPRRQAAQLGRFSPGQA